VCVLATCADDDCPAPSPQAADAVAAADPGPTATPDVATPSDVIADTAQDVLPPDEGQTTPDAHIVDTTVVDVSDAGPEDSQRPPSDGGTTPPDCGTCPPDEAPVCVASESGELTTYINPCFAQCEMASTDAIVCGAGCPPADACSQCADDGCAPVCGVDDNTYYNGCYAACDAGVDLAYPFVCCDCPIPADDTMWCSEEGETHGNLCLLLCKQQTPAYAAPCTDGCQTSEDDPPDGVCGNKDGALVGYPNVDCAELAGATCITEGACVATGNPCPQTHTEYEPVCATVPDADGVPQLESFPNKCFAGCAMATDWEAGLCEDCATLCADAEPEPICAIPQCVVYPDKCVLKKCMGFIDTADWAKLECPVACD